VTVDADRLAARVLPAALELATAYTAAGTEPALFWEAMRRVVGEAQTGADPARAVAELVFGQAALAGILMDELASQTGQDRADVIAEIHRRYLAC
jgi:hypothetical protein